MSIQALRKPETPCLPPELLGAVPREVRLTAGGIAVVVVAIALAIGALASTILMSVAYVRAEDEQQLRGRDGVAAQAEVIQVATARGEHPRRIATYRYQVDGRSYTGRASRRERDPRLLTLGAELPIKYVASHPETSWTVGYEPGSFPLWTIPLVTLSLAAGSAATAYRLRRQWVLLSEGRVAEARITGHEKIHKKERTAYSVSYEFRTLSGARQAARCEVGKTPPAIGTLVPVVYHREKPHWSAAYPLQFVRPSRAPRRGENRFQHM